MLLRRWRTTQLFAAWLGYWALLAVVALGRPLLLAREIRGLPPGRASASLGFGDQGFHGKVVIDHVTRWSADVSFGALVLWVVVPPMLLWIAWMAVRPRPEDVTPAALGAGERFGEATRPRDRVREDR